MLMRTDPLRDFDRLAHQFLGGAPGTWSKPAMMPMDAYRMGEHVVAHFDLPGVTPDSIDLQVERNVLTVRAERRPTQADADVHTMVSERPLGVFSRQLFLGDVLDTEHIDASYDAGVLTLRIPVAEKSKPRKVHITSATSQRQQITG